MDNVWTQVCLLCRSEYGNIMYDKRIVRGNTYALHTLPAVSGSLVSENSCRRLPRRSQSLFAVVTARPPGGAASAGVSAPSAGQKEGAEPAQALLTRCSGGEEAH